MRRRDTGRPVGERRRRCPLPRHRTARHGRAKGRRAAGRLPGYRGGDAVGSDVDNLSLSDRRAESVALVLSQQFGVAPENLTTQGYGAHYLKVPRTGPERANRRVTVRRITPLLTGQNQPLPAPR